VYVRDFAEQIVNINIDMLSPKTLDAAKKSILDTLGVAIKGSGYESSAVLEKTLALPNDRQISSLIGRGVKSTPLEAALFNGTAAHSVEMDDFHRAAAVHPGVVIIPAALAAAEEIGASGHDLLKAVIVGYEVMVRIGVACSGSPYDRGFHPTSICGAFGAAAAAGALYGLPADRLAQAMGIAGGYTGGLLEYKANGAWTKRLNAGLAAQSGVLAAKLAGNGFTGPESILEGRFGFLKAYADSYDLEALQKPWQAAGSWAIEEVTFKPYSSCRFTHAPIDAFDLVLQQNKLSVQDIEQVLVETHQMAIKATMEPAERKYRPVTQVDAQFSIPFCLALLAVKGGVVPDYFTPSFFADEDVLALAAKVSGQSAERYTKMFPKKNGSQVSVLAHGIWYRSEVLDAKGDPENPLSIDELLQKFRLLTADIIESSKLSRLSDLLLNIEKMDNVSKLSDLLCR